MVIIPVQYSQPQQPRRLPGQPQAAQGCAESPPHQPGKRFKGMSADQPHLRPNQIQKQINLLLRDSPTICQPAQHHPGQYLLRYQSGIFH